MRRRNTIKDLNDFLVQNPNEIELDDVHTKEDFLKKSPNNIVDVKHEEIVQEFKGKTNIDLSIAEIASYLHEKAQKENKSFSELWLSLIEEGAKIDPLLKNTSAFKMIKKIHTTGLSVAFEGISKLMKGK